jgi:DNA-binding NtrC family response regulator
VLIVSGDEDLILLLEFLLQADGFQVAVSRTKDLAIQALLRDRPEAIFIDLQPQEDNWGLSPVEFIQQTCPTISIFTVVRPEFAEAAKQSLRRGAHGFLLTPVDYRGVKSLLGGNPPGSKPVSTASSMYHSKYPSAAVH